MSIATERRQFYDRKRSPFRFLVGRCNHQENGRLYGVDTPANDRERDNRGSAGEHRSLIIAYRVLVEANVQPFDSAKL